jgi:hypothetical protein
MSFAGCLLGILLATSSFGQKISNGMFLSTRRTSNLEESTTAEKADAEIEIRKS